jgi:hypothetical protein
MRTPSVNEAMFACSCETPPFASLDDCIETRSAQLAALTKVM